MQKSRKVARLRHAEFFVCGYAFLQIVARLRHAVICQDSISSFSFMPLGNCSKKINQRRILESVPILPAKVKLSVAVGWSEPANGFPTVQEIHIKTYLEGSTSASANPRGRCSTFQVDDL